MLDKPLWNARVEHSGEAFVHPGSLAGFRNYKFTEVIHDLPLLFGCCFDFSCWMSFRPLMRTFDVPSNEKLW